MIDEARIAFLMKKLGISREEAIELEDYDENVKRNRKTEFDLTAEQRQNVMEMNRKRDHKKSGPRTVERKPNELKESIVAVLADFLANDAEFTLNSKVVGCDDVIITNKNRMIHFVIGEREFDLQLIEKRLPKQKA